MFFYGSYIYLFFSKHGICILKEQFWFSYKYIIYTIFYFHLTPSPKHSPHKPPTQPNLTPLNHKPPTQAWKARVTGYEELIKLFNLQTDEKSPEFSKYLGLVKKFVVDSNVVAQEKGLEATLIFVENSYHAGKWVWGSEFGEVSLEEWVSYNHHPKLPPSTPSNLSHYLTIHPKPIIPSIFLLITLTHPTIQTTPNRTAGEVGGSVVTKVLNQKTKIKELGVAVLMAYIEAEKQEIVQVIGMGLWLLEVK